ncbi:MAG: hypothetical protein WD578_09515 [Bacteroidales bacterium]
MSRLLQFGAGKIGRSFIAQIFGKAGYGITFVDIDPCLVKSLNEAGAYNVIIKGIEIDDRYVVRNVSAIEISSTKNVIASIVEADIISISVGKSSLLKLARILAMGIKVRYSQRADNPVDIILAENVRNAAQLLSEEIERLIPDLPVHAYVGFVETSIGKMVPLMTEEQIRQDPLAIYAEPYNNLIVDARAFRGPMPEVPEIDPKKYMRAWVDRKIYILNLGHAVLAYQCNYSFPEIVHIWEALENPEIYKITRDTMVQSAAILQKMYNTEFTMPELTLYIDDVLYRFTNRALADTIFRVGSDIPRKLAREDRLMNPVENAIRLQLPYDMILEAWVKGCYFKSKDSQGRYFPADKKFRHIYGDDLHRILAEHCKFSPGNDHDIFNSVKKIQKQLAQ